ncbi:MAG: FliH/SctL family protein [Pseudomonadota bacterium]
MKARFTNQIQTDKRHVILNPISELAQDASQDSKATSHHHDSRITPSQETPSLDKTQLRELFQDELQQWQQEAQQKGYEEGLAQAHQENQAALETQKQQFSHKHSEQQKKLLHAQEQCTQLINQLENTLIQAKQESEDLLLEVLVTSLTKILGQHHQDKTLAKAVLENNLKRVQDTVLYQIRCHPDDLNYLQKENQWSHIQLTADETLLPGGCVIESQLGHLDARIDQQLHAFKTLLLTTREEK